MILSFVMEKELALNYTSILKNNNKMRKLKTHNSLVSYENWIKKSLYSTNEKISLRIKKKTQ